MTTIEKSALVRFSAPQMFALVEDIESYPQFLPWCRSSRILKREGEAVEAELEIARAGFHKSFATRNTQKGQDEIHIRLLRGPFSHLEGIWRFQPLREDASKISLELEFELSGRLADLAFGAVFNQICNTLVGAFTERAKTLYGAAK
jgi:ribosome-associated toxin RatA of RatAB toxin-antitoxin module